MAKEEFLKEAHERRPFGMYIIPQYMPAAFSPEDRDMFGSAVKMKEYYNWRDETFAQPIKESDHPNIAEVKRRLVDIVVEGRELGFY